jgi:DNA replication protein DnaC
MNEFEPVSLQCAVHGAYMSHPVVLNGKLLIAGLHCTKCAADEAAAREEKLIAAAAAEKQARIAKRMGVAGIPEGFITRTLENFTAELDGQKRALLKAKQYVKAFPQHRDTGYSMLFLGDIGCGKTHLAVAIAQAVMAMGYSALYETASDAVTRLRDCMRRDSPIGTGALLDMYGAIDLLVLDEFGVQSGTDDVVMHLTNIIDRRYRNSKPTLFLSNLDNVAFPAYVGERVADRLRERASAVTFNWPSYRAKARLSAGF